MAAATTEITIDPFLALFGGELPEPAAPEPGGQRSRSGCFTCRRRKVKCDESRPICEKCQIGQRDVSQLSSLLTLYTELTNSTVHLAAR